MLAEGRPFRVASPGCEPAFRVLVTDDLAGAVAHAIECGATVADHQPQDDVKVMLDPDGHPFCLFTAQIL